MWTDHVIWPALIGLAAWLPFVSPAMRYYGEYTVYGTGDTILQTFHAHGGPNVPHRKWHIECLDGEAAIGLGDLVNDYQQVTEVWCKFMFPLKPPTNGLYPYYPSCIVRNYTVDFHCYAAKDHEQSINTFVTGLWDNDFQWWLFRGPPDNINPYKCCKTPLGYYIDYLSCYYMPTKDMYGEYYDNANIMLVYCATEYVMTGIGKKVNAWSGDAHVDWIQCCRVGVGGVPIYRPPQHSYSYDSYANNTYPNKPTGRFAAQYQGQNLGPQMMSRGFQSAEVPAISHERPAPAMGGPMFAPVVARTNRSVEHEEEDLDAPY